MGIHRQTVSVCISKKPCSMMIKKHVYEYDNTLCIYNTDVNSAEIYIYNKKQYILHIIKS